MSRFPLAAALLLIVSCSGGTKPGPSPASAPGTAPDEKGVRVSGPYVQDTLAIYLVHAASQNKGDFITLDEGLKNGSVTVTEKADQQVNELELENKGDRPLFIQEGDRVIGGQQDRIIGRSFVVPAKSGRIPVPSFCVEEGRWSGESRGFIAGGNNAFASKACRIAAKVSGDQGQVWERVSKTKSDAAVTLAYAGADFRKTTSLNDVLEDPKVKELCDKAAAAVAALLEKNPDAVGAAISINGKIEEIDVYPGHALLVKVLPRLVRSYAVLATAKGAEVAWPKAEIVAAMMAASSSGKEKKETVVGNEFVLEDGDKAYSCRTDFQGLLVHRQWLCK